MRPGNSRIAAVFGVIALLLGFKLFGWYAPLAFLVVGLALWSVKVSAYREGLRQWANAQYIPGGDWLIQYNVLTEIGCKKLYENRIVGPFSLIALLIGKRTPEEVEQIRRTVMDAFEGGYNWVTLYDPIGISKEQQSEACATITIRFTPLPDKRPCRRK